MDRLAGMDSGKCPRCGRRLRNSVFCRVCGETLCSWICYLGHVAEHAHIHAGNSNPSAVVESGSAGNEPAGNDQHVLLDCRV